MGSSYFTSAHPWYPEDEVYQATDDPTGDVEQAKQILRDAGWGWDDDGNLRYPADADLSPRWPKGEYPNEDNGFPCVTADGEYNQTENLL
jgi:peptide/nickel transport system substrate-binding protein